MLTELLSSGRSKVRQSPLDIVGQKPALELGKTGNFKPNKVVRIMGQLSVHFIGRTISRPQPVAVNQISDSHPSSPPVRRQDISANIRRKNFYFHDPFTRCRIVFINFWELALPASRFLFFFFKMAPHRPMQCWCFDRTHEFAFLASKRKRWIETLNS